MKVLHFSKFYPPEVGGIESFIFDLVEQLSKQIRCDVLCANTNNKTIVEKRKTYTVFRAASFGKVFATSVSPAIIGLLKKLKGEYDLIHLHLPNPLANFTYFLVRPEAKLVLHWHSDILRQKKLMLLYKPLQDWLLKRADLIITTSENYLKNSEYLRKYKEKCTVIPLGLNPDRLLVDEDNVREIKNRFDDKPIVFSLGRLIYYKGLEYLIDAMKDVNAYLLIGGTGPLQGEMQDQIKKSSLTEKVFLLGRIEEGDLGAYYQACDVFCLPSIYKTEAFGLVQVEAMACGKPVINTDLQTGVPWVSRDGETGITVSPADSTALAKAINRLFEDSDLREKYGRNALRRVEKYFGVTRMLEDIYKVYEKVLG